jgi:hypothetical protein
MGGRFFCPSVSTGAASFSDLRGRRLISTLLPGTEQFSQLNGSELRRAVPAPLSIMGPSAQTVLLVATLFRLRLPSIFAIECCSCPLVPI